MFVSAKGPVALQFPWFPKVVELAVCKSEAISFEVGFPPCVERLAPKLLRDGRAFHFR